jgi:hypothetical protein
MSWGQHVIEGVAYDLSHLDPFVVAATLPENKGGGTLRVLVTFGSHTFTREIVEGDPETHHFVDDTDRRCFCPIRHGHSRHLPDIVQRAANGRVFFSEGRNLLCVDWVPGCAAPYAAFFNLVKYKQKGLHAAMFVVSAYDKPNLPEKLPAIAFTTLVTQVMAGKAPVAPRDIRSIKR